MTVGVLATHESYRQHLRPVAAAAASLVDISWLENMRLLYDVHPDTWVTASLRDFLAVRPKRARRIHLEHGCGLQWYGRSHVRQITGAASIIAAPNEFVAARYREFSLKTRVEVVGTPKMDELTQLARCSDGRTVATSFHWTSAQRVGPPWQRYRSAIRALAAAGVTVLGHAHPRVWSKAEAFYREIGVEPVEAFTEVVKRADVYACDHSSTIYEFAALDRPVVLLERPGALQLVPHPSGLLYTEHAEVGATATPETFVALAMGALDGDPEHAPQRRAASDALFPFIGTSTQRVVDLIRDMTEG